jgi:hypothetical protein
LRVSAADKIIDVYNGLALLPFYPALGHF